MKRLTLIFLMIIFLAGCKKKTSTLYIVFNYNTLTKVPNKKSEIVTISTLMNFYDPLVRFDADFRPYPSLAEYWENPDSITWVLKLRKNIKFVDGKSFTSEDVLYTFYKTMHDSTSDYRTDVHSIDTILAKGPYTVIFKLNSPCLNFLERISQILIIEKNCSPELLSSLSCGTGPLRFTKEDKNGTIYAIPNNEYFGRKVKFDKIIFITKDVLAKNHLKSPNNKYFLFTVKPPNGFQKQLNFIKIPGPVNAIRYIGANTKRWPLNKKAFRRALYLALCRKKLADTISKLYGYPIIPAYEIALFSQVGFLSYKTNDCIQRDSIQKLLKISGYRGEPIHLLLSKTRLPYAQFIKNNLKEVGINIKIDPVKPSELFKRVKGREDLSLFLLALIPGSIDIHTTGLSYFHSREETKSLGAKNYFSYSNPSLDSLIEGVGQLSEEQERKKVLQKIESMLIDELPAIPLVYEGDNYYISKELNYKPHIDRVILANDITLDNEY